MAKGKARDLAKEARWRKVLAAQRRSGLSVRRYCQAKALAESSIWFWKRELARRDGQERPQRRRGPGRRRSVAGAERRGPRALRLLPVTIGPARQIVTVPRTALPEL